MINGTDITGITFDKQGETATCTVDVVCPAGGDAESVKNVMALALADCIEKVVDMVRERGVQPILDSGYITVGWNLPCYPEGTPAKITRATTMPKDKP